MGTTKTLSREERAAKIRTITEREYRKGTPLPTVRKTLAKTLGGDASLYLGTADPIYYRLAGLDAPLLDGKGKPLPAEPKTAVLRAAVRRRRDDGVRWETLAASIEATTGRRASVPEAKALYAKAGGSLDASYVGRGTRAGAPETLADLALAAEAGSEA